VRSRRDLRTETAGTFAGTRNALQPDQSISHGRHNPVSDDAAGSGQKGNGDGKNGVNSAADEGTHRSPSGGLDTNDSQGRTDGPPPRVDGVVVSCGVTAKRDSA